MVRPLHFLHSFECVQITHAFHLGWLPLCFNDCNIHKHELVPCFQVVEWKQRLEEFEKRVQALDVLLMRLFVGPNKSVLCDIYAYLWDMKGVLGTCLAYVRWLGKSYIFLFVCICVYV